MANVLVTDPETIALITAAFYAGTMPPGYSIRWETQGGTTIPIIYEVADDPTPPTWGNPETTLLDSRLDAVELAIANALEFGATGDGTTNDTAALQSFLNALSTTKQPGVIPPGSYRVYSKLNVGANTTLSMYGATLLCYDPDLGSGGYGNDVPVLSIGAVSRVVITGGTIDGRKASFAATEFKAGVGIYGASNITLRDVRAVSCKGDGLHISLITSGGTAPSNVVMERCTADANHRQGMSIIALRNGRFSDCDFINTVGTNPQSGVDIEPNLVGEVVTDVFFDRCSFDGNAGSGFIVSTVAASTTQHGITVSNSSVRGNTQWGVWLASAKDVSFSRCQIEENGTNGVWILGGTNKQLTFDKCTIRSNGDSGILFFGSDAVSSVVDVKITNNRIGRNSLRAADSFNGLFLGDIALASAMTDILVSGNTIGEAGATDQFIGVYFAEATTFLTTRINDNHLTNENTLNTYPGTAPAGVSARGNIGMTDV